MYICQLRLPRVCFDLDRKYSLYAAYVTLPNRFPILSADGVDDTQKKFLLVQRATQESLHQHVRGFHLPQTGADVTNSTCSGIVRQKGSRG